MITLNEFDPHVMILALQFAISAPLTSPCDAPTRYDHCYIGRLDGYLDPIGYTEASLERR